SSFGVMSFGNDPNEYNMTTDDKGRIWLNFGRETALATPLTNGKYQIEKTQFLSFTDRVTYKIFPDKNGIIWLATNEGLIRYNESIKKDYNKGFETVLRKIIAGDSALSSIQDSAIKKTSLAFKNNTLRFEYAAPFFDREDKMQFQTWLEGFQKDWS